MDTQILIIGAGPVGMVSALSLAQAGIRCLLVDRRLDRLDAPKAHAVNARTLEICERLGMSAEEIRAAGASTEDGGLVHFVDTLSGTCFGSLPYERQDDDARAFTPWPLVNIPQPRFEAMLNAQLTRRSGVSLLRGVNAEQLDQHDGGVSVTLRGEGYATPLTVRCDYVIAADGANSSIRDELGISLDGPEGLAHNMMIHFQADLTTLTRDRPGLLYFCLAPTVQGAFIGYERSSNWVFMQPYDPQTQSLADFDDDTCKRLVEAAAGVGLEDFKLRNVSPWTMSAQVAEHYGRGRVFLAGDAAHRFPPTGGLGLNTGVADAQNLCWKLAQVLRGQASPALLDSYEAERRPVAQINTHQSLTNSAKMFHLLEAVYGNDPVRVAESYANACAHPDLPEIVEAIEIQRPHFDSFNLQLGYRYGATVDPDAIDISHYEPSFETGDFLPLIELQDQPWLLGSLRNDAFSLITGPEGSAWRCDALDVFCEDSDFQPVKPFFSRAGLEADGALLIRPDGHIAARWNRAPEHPAAAVGRCLEDILGMPATREVA